MKVLGNRKPLEAPAKASWCRRFWGLGSGTAAVALVVAIAGGGVIFGCVRNLSELHNSAPSLYLISSKPPEQLGNCVLYEAKNYRNIWWGVPHMTLVNREGVYYLVMEGGPGIPFAEVSFSPSPDGGSKVEYRVSDRGNCDRTCRFIWDYVEKCK